MMLSRFWGFRGFEVYGVEVLGFCVFAFRGSRVLGFGIKI